MSIGKHNDLDMWATEHEKKGKMYPTAMAEPRYS